MRRCGKPGTVFFFTTFFFFLTEDTGFLFAEVVYFSVQIKKLRHDAYYISINQSCVVEHLHVHSLWWRHLHKSLHWSGASVSVDLHGSSIQHLALSLRALFQDEDGFLSV